MAEGGDRGRGDDRPAAILSGVSKARIDSSCAILRNPSAGETSAASISRCKVPRVATTCCGLAAANADQAMVKGLKWAGVAQVTLGGLDLIVSRTGYTGERVAYELFAHPDQAAELFRKLDRPGRDSLRLGSPRQPAHGGGFASIWIRIVRRSQHEPGRCRVRRLCQIVQALLHWQRSLHRVRIATGRFRSAAFGWTTSGARPAHNGDPIVNARGRVVGIVTSCNIDSEGFQLGQALMQKEFRKRGLRLSVFAGSARAKVASLGNLSIGKRVAMPEPLTILSRFPKRK